MTTSVHPRWGVQLLPTKHPDSSGGMGRKTALDEEVLLQDACDVTGFFNKCIN